MDKQQEEPRTTAEGYGRFTKEEMDWLKSTFGSNDRALKILRKVFIPSYDLNAEIGQVVDLWLPLDIEKIPPHDREIIIIARNRLILHIEQMLSQIKILAGLKEETAEEREERFKKDSNK